MSMHPPLSVCQPSELSVRTSVRKESRRAGLTLLTADRLTVQPADDPVSPPGGHQAAWYLVSSGVVKSSLLRIGWAPNDAAGGGALLPHVAHVQGRHV